jgi:hypothetical protein
VVRRRGLRRLDWRLRVQSVQALLQLAHPALSLCRLVVDGLQLRPQVAQLISDCAPVREFDEEDDVVERGGDEAEEEGHQKARRDGELGVPGVVVDAVGHHCPDRDEDGGKQDAVDLHAPLTRALPPPEAPIVGLVLPVAPSD